MRYNPILSYWRKNKEWYRINYEKDEFKLTDKAPEKAKKNFEMWNNPDKYGNFH